MKLREYLDREGLSQEAFGNLLGKYPFKDLKEVSQGMVGHWLAEPPRCEITSERAVQIEMATGGKVSRKDLRPDIFGKAA